MFSSCRYFKFSLENMQLCQAFEQGPVKHEEKYTLMIVNGLP